MSAAMYVRARSTRAVLLWFASKIVGWYLRLGTDDGDGCPFCRHQAQYVNLSYDTDGIDPHRHITHKNNINKADSAMSSAQELIDDFLVEQHCVEVSIKHRKGWRSSIRICISSFYN